MSVIAPQGVQSEPAAGKCLKVFLTVDAEAWPRFRDWRETGLRQDVDREIYGATPSGRFGIGYQMDLLDRYGLKAHDSSYNACYPDADCGLKLGERMLQPQPLLGLYEFPIAFFSDWPGRLLVL